MATRECKIEFYFKREQLEKLLADNPSAKGIIVKQEIIPRKQPNGKVYNLVTITARPDKKTKSRGVKAGEEIIDGCPFPPGCTE